MIEIHLNGVEFVAQPVEVEDGVTGKLLIFRDPESGLRVIIGATDQECADFAARLESDDGSGEDQAVREV